MHGVVVGVLGSRARPTGPTDAGPRLGMPRLGRRARRGHGAVRRQHVVRRGAPRERARRSCSTPAPACGRSASRWTATAPSELHILLTHLHLDHLQGLGFFRPLFQPGLDMHIWGPPSPVQTLAERIAMYLSPPLFPVRLDDVPAQLTFHDAPEEAVTIGSATVRAGQGDAPGPDRRLPHRGGRPRRSSTCPITSRRSAATSSAQPDEWISGYDIARDADVLLHDAQYRDDEYPHHVGWGHSASADAMEFARQGRRRPARAVPPRPVPHRRRARRAARRGPPHASTGADDWVCLAYEGMSVRFDENGVHT